MLVHVGSIPASGTRWG